MNSRSVIDSIQSIAVLRALHLGDMLCAVPAWRALRRRFPKAWIALVGLPWARDFVERFRGYFDEFIEFPGFPGLPEQALQPERIARFLLDMQARKFDLVLQMQGSGHYANECVSLWGSRLSAGFCLANEYVPQADLYLPYPEHIPEIHRHLRLMAFLGCRGKKSDKLEFPLTPEDTRAFVELATQVGTPVPFPTDRLACIHPGGHSVARRWSATGFAQVADALMDQGIHVVLTGTAEERDLTRHVASIMKRLPIDLAGHTSLGTLGVLFQRARLLISNSTGVAHLACALDLPSIVISKNCDSQRWGPLDRIRHRLHEHSRVTVGSIVADADELLTSPPPG